MIESMTAGKNLGQLIVRVLTPIIREIVEQVIDEKLNEAKKLPARSPSDVLLTIKEASKIAKVQETTVRLWCREDLISYSKVGRSYRINRTDLMEHLASKNSWIANH